MDHQAGVAAISSSSNTNTIFPNRKALSNSSLEILNWMIHVKYTRKEFATCRRLAEEELKRSNNYNEYANFILGNIYKEEGEVQKALEYFRQCKTLNPQNVEYLKQIGRCLFLLGRYKLALETFLKAEELTETADWNIYHHLGVCYLKTQQEDRALEYLKQAVLSGRSEKSFRELAKLYEHQKDHVNAVNTLKAALRLYPSSTELSVSLALMYMDVQDYKNAFNQLGSALAHDPINAEALFTFAAEIQRHGDYDVALVKYKLAAQSLPESAEMWNNIGMCFFGKHRIVAAITCLKRSSYLNPLNWLTTYNLGLLHLNTKQFASAAIFLSTTAKLNSLHGPTYTLLALALKRLGDEVNSRRSFEEALKRNENDVEACINYALFLYTINEKAEALKHYSHYQHLLNITPNVNKELIRMGAFLTDALRTSNQILEGEDENPTTSTDRHDEDNEVAVDETREKFLPQKREKNSKVGDQPDTARSESVENEELNADEDLV